MKKSICLFLSIIICLMCVIPANAANQSFEAVNSETVIMYEDGSYLIISPIYCIENNSRATTSTKNAYQTYTYNDSSGAIEWQFVLNATFSYVYGSSVTCTNASYDYIINESSWKFSDGSTSISGATAYGYGTFKNKVLFVTTKTVNAELAITCDVYGNLS